MGDSNIKPSDAMIQNADDAPAAPAAHSDMKEQVHSNDAIADAMSGDANKASITGRSAPEDDEASAWP